ncbi:MAG TPA: hypothetical protein VLF71_00430 [Candidatus Saccharimonadales bacterium]|nr:hypothetical protein [Candidatus Saccharimonadales bacterium]
MTLRYKKLLVAAVLAAYLAAPAMGASAAAAEKATTAARPSSASTDGTEANRLQNIKTKGDAEIGRRLATLGKLFTNIDAATKLSASSKDALATEVSTEASALAALRTKLAGETTVAAAAADVQSMVSEYRVYALLVPKVQLVRAADDQQVAEQKLSDLATKLDARLSAAEKAGKNVGDLRVKLTDMAQNITNAQGISTSVESKVLPLQPSDYDSDHTVLSGYRDQLKTAHADNQAAYADAKAIVQGVKGL